MAYRHNDTLHKHQVRAKRIRKVAFTFSTVLVVAFLVVAVDWVTGQLSTSNTVTTRTTQSSVQSANASVYRTEYFQFQAPEEWVLVTSESTDKKFVYLKDSDTQITQKLVVYIDRKKIDKEADFKLTRVLPVEVSTLGNLTKQATVSSHCNESFPVDGNRDARRVTHENVSFVCNPDSAQYTVLVGEAGGTEELSFVMNDGREIKVVMVYSDLTAYPGTGDLYNIVSSFSIL